MAVSTAFKATFIGSGSLLVACVEMWRQAGNTLHGVVTLCPVATAWCDRNGIGHIAPSDDQAAWLGRDTFDYLFSIVNHAITPAEILNLPTRRAINFHDSLLPKYAGFNATAWAIMSNEAQHGVTWHAMTADVDGGDILLQQMIDILDDEVAFSLGAKCIEAGRSSFQTLIGMLAEEASGKSLTVTNQSPSQNFHLRSDRPGLGVIDFSKPKREIRNFVRAMNLGSDDNWMCRPKLALPSGLFIVENAEVVARPQAAPGTIVAVDSKGVEIAAVDGVLRFELFSTLEGGHVDPLATGAAVGDVLASEGYADAAAVADAVFTKHERFWVGRLATMRAPNVAGLKPHTGAAQPALEIRKLPAALTDTVERRTALAAALLTYIARTGEDDNFDLALTKTLSPGLQNAYARHVPFRVAVNKSGNFDLLRSRVAQELEIQDKRGSYARDAVTRYQALRSTNRALLTAGIQFSDLEHASAEAMLAVGQSLSLIIPDTGDSFAWAYDARAIEPASLKMLADRVDVLLASGLKDGSDALSSLEILPTAERSLLLDQWQDTAIEGVPALGIHQMFEMQVARTPDAVALRFKDDSLTYRQLNDRANSVAEALRSSGVLPGVLVAVGMERSLDLVVGLFGVLKAGAAYVPLDPAYPRDRLAMMVEDSAAMVLLTQKHLVTSLPPAAVTLCIEDIPARAVVSQVASKPDDLAYVIFTSGSTGRPKGVMVRHRNVANFFTGMDQRIGTKPGVWLAVTSVSFDISVLEIFWTLARGFEVVMQGESDRASIARVPTASARKEPMDFSLFYFAAGQGSSGAGDAYRLLLEGAKFADTHDFSAVWTPERHFHEFGGPYPNPAVTSAALATITSRVSLRAGSVVLPLHNPLRVAEDWSVIDQLSGGRVGLSFASGWHADDFAFMPQNYERRREVMLESIETITRLWRGEKVETINGQGKTISVNTLPRPLQAMPPMWIASAGSVDTFKAAGRIGANVLTNMLGQDIDDLRNKFAAYHKARREAGHDGPGVITVMLHTFVCEDTEKARELAREPFCNYLKSSFDLIKVAPSMFPAFRQPSLGNDESDGKGFDTSRFTADDMAALMDHAFDRYFETAGLFGSPSKALAMVDRLKSIGANELACLIDFGIDTDIVLKSLPHLDQLRQMSRAADDQADERDYSIPAQLRDRKVTHLQCTPSLARMIVSDPDGMAGVSRLDRLLLGGEALPVDLADILAPLVSGEVHNMYGPTEATIWSTTSPIIAGETITIGRPIANTVIRILDEAGQLAPIGIAGELYIGGDGVAVGYLGRQDLTAERFVTDPYAVSGLLYRTGDLARYVASGDIEFLGRADFQVKLNGYRIELGEIEAALGRHDLVGQAVVTARADDGQTRLVAYVTPANGARSVISADEQVARWEGLWDGAYRDAGQVADPRFNIAGWNDSATGLPIPREQMIEWLDGVESRIVALAPRRILEIGFGTGMVLYRMLPHVEHYTGVDLSSHALDAIQKELKPEERERVSLFQQPAHALAGVANQSFDTVVINSVSQYFPDASYLEKVLRRASEIVSESGSIFVGDVRSLEQFEAFHTDVILQQVSDGASQADIAKRLDQRIAKDGELVVAEAFFHALARDLPRAPRVEVHLKPGRASNEMSAFRYDVIIRFGAQSGQTLTPINVPHKELMPALNRGEPAVMIRDLLNARVAGVHAAGSALRGSNKVHLAGLRELVSAKVNGAIEPTDLAATHPGYTVEIMPARSGDGTRFDALFRSRALDEAAVIACGAPQHDKAATHYARNPRLDTPAAMSIDDLRAYLRSKLPEYMVPSSFVMLDAFPLTPNGKIDRKALPAPTKVIVPAEATDHVAATNAIEETIADVWKSLLGVERVGLRDNIFDLGVNSLLTVQANQRLSALLDRKIALVAMFRYPTVEALAAHLTEGQASEDTASRRAQDRDARKKDAADRRRELRSAKR